MYTYPIILLFIYVCYSQLKIFVLFYLFETPFLSILILTMHIKCTFCSALQWNVVFCQCNVKSLNERSTRCAILPQNTRAAYIIGHVVLNLC